MTPAGRNTPRSTPPWLDPPYNSALGQRARSARGDLHHLILFEIDRPYGGVIAAPAPVHPALAGEKRVALAHPYSSIPRSWSMDRRKDASSRNRS